MANFTVNGQAVEVDADPKTPLLWVIREHLKITGTKFGCGVGQCGACTVLVNGSPVRSCITPVSAIASAEVTTLEGLGDRENPHPVQEAFIAEQAAQCGYCSNGMIMAVASLLERNSDPSDSEIRQALAGNLCRCGTHTRILKAVRRAAQNPA